VVFLCRCSFSLFRTLWMTLTSSSLGLLLIINRAESSNGDNRICALQFKLPVLVPINGLPASYLPKVVNKCIIANALSKLNLMF